MHSRSKHFGNLSIPGVTQEKLQLTSHPRFLDKHQKPKDDPPSLNKTEKAAGSKQDFLLYTTTTHPPTIKALQTTKITKLGVLSLPPLALNRIPQCQNWKDNKYFDFPGNNPGSSERNSEVLTIRSLLYVQNDYRKAIYT